MRAPVSDALLRHRRAVLEGVADAVAGALEHDRVRNKRRYTDYREIARRLGREVNRTLPHILKEGDTTVTTLADLALVCGCELKISLTPKS